MVPLSPVPEDAKPTALGAAAYWSMPVDRIAALLGCGSAGLSSAEANDRLQQYGDNSLTAKTTMSAPRLFLRQYESPLILILVFAACVAAVVRDWTDTVIVLAIVAVSGVLSFFQEFRASRALLRLRNRVQLKSMVIRDGLASTIPTSAVVPGDVVVLKAGSLAPADGVLLEAKDLYVSESALTGESLPVEKQAGICAADASLAARTNCIHMGTSVRSGTGRALIVSTGTATVFGSVAGRLRLRAPETDFERSVRQYGQLLTWFMIVLVFLVFTANLSLARPPIESLLFAVALAVGISPELLPAVITVTLTSGAREMGAHGVIVRRLNAIENFGSMDILCSDKTGTLTEGTVELEAALNADGDPLDRPLLLAYLNARLQSGMENPLDRAISAKGEAAKVDISNFRKIDEVPYDFVRRRLTIAAQQRGETETLLITKGAFANVLEACRDVRSGTCCTPLVAQELDALRSRFERWSADGYRVLGLASKAAANRSSFCIADESDLTFEGFLLFSDPPKPGIETTLRSLAGNGVQLKIITGDNRVVTSHLGTQIGIAAPAILTGSELSEMREEALLNLAPHTDFFVEVDPIQKERIVVALKKSGHVVGFLGDGINDASALHAADVSISVDGAEDVAREAADFVLLERDLEVLNRGIQLGRKTFANTLKYIAITTSANFGNMISMAAASFLLPFLPLLAKQILLNNFLSDIPGMCIASDRVDSGMIWRPQRFDIRAIRRFSISFGLISSAFDFLTFAVLLYGFAAGPEMFRTGWFFESLMTELGIVFVVRTYKPFYRARPGRLLLWTTLAVMILTFALPYLPFRGEFDFVPLNASLVLVLSAIAVLYIAASELAKHRWVRIPVPARG